MKKIISSFILGSLCLSSAVTVPAQKDRSDFVRSAIVKKGLFAENRAFTDGKGVWVDWETGSEKGYLGFRVFALRNGEKELISPEMISGLALSASDNTGEGKSYGWFDQNGSQDTRYIVEAIAQDGSIASSKQFGVAVIADLKALTGHTSDDLMRGAAQPSQSKTEKESLILPTDLAAETQNRPAAPETAPIDTQHMIAGLPGVKIAVKQEGMYRVTKTQMQAAGFDTSAANTNWQLYTDGVQQPLGISANNDYIEFYGRGVDLTETDTRIYYLINGTTPGKRIGSTVLRAINNKVTNNSFTQSTLVHENLSYLNQVLNGEKSNFFGRLVTTSGGVTNINLKNVDTTASNAVLEVNVQGFSLVAHQVQVLLNDVALGTLNGANRDLLTGVYNIPASNLREGQNVLKLIASNSSDTSFTEDVKMTYKRKFAADANRLSFYTANYRGGKVEGFTSSAIRVFDLTETNNIKQVENVNVQANGSTFDLLIPSGRAKVLYAVADSAILAPFAVTANQPSNLTDNAASAQLIIISYKDWMTQANDWAAYRRADGLSAKVVNVEDVYDEFGYGMPTAESIRSFLSYAKDNWQVTPKYVFLIGDASYDPRNFYSTGNANYVPAKIVDTTYMETGSDEALADFDNDGLAEMPVGRLPIRDGNTVTTILNKVKAWEQNVSGSFTRGALFTSDLPDGYDFQAMSNRLTTSLPTNMPVTNVNRSASDANSQVLNAINSGRYIINYTGHGTFAAWAGNMLNRTDVANLTNSNSNLTIANMLTCLNGYYIEVNQDGLVETMVKKETGGAVIGWGSSALTTPDIQETMATRFFTQLKNSTMTRMGDYVIDAKGSIGGGRDVRLSWVLLGDPTLKVK